MPKIKIDRADYYFSKYIRTRDKWTCQRCRRQYPINSQGLHCSHYYGRAKESTRFEPDNADCLCYGCHQHWGSADREGYRNFKIKQIGKQRFKTLEIQANTYQKKDRKLQKIIWKKAYEDLVNKYDDKK